MQNRLFDIGASSLSQRGRDRKSTSFTIVQNGTELDGGFQGREQKASTSRKEWKWQRGIVTHPPSESRWNRSHFSMKKVGV